MKKNTQPTDDAYQAALTPEALEEMTHELQEQVTHVDLKYTLTNQVAIDLLLRTVIALLKGRNGADDYVRNRLHGAAGHLGYTLLEKPEEECNQGEPCPFHPHTNDPFRARYRRILRGE